jgi:hypothetical protein
VLGTSQASSQHSVSISHEKTVLSTVGDEFSEEVVVSDQWSLIMGFSLGTVNIVFVMWQRKLLRQFFFFWWYWGLNAGP